MKYILEVTCTFLIFHELVSTQFGAKIFTLQSDNDRQYFNQTMIKCLENEGIVYHSSCVDTPQQNGVVERKN